MHKNVGLADSFLRTFMGLYLLSRGTHHGCRLLSFAGAIQSASGLMHYCPVYHLLGIHTLSSCKSLSHLWK